MKFVIPLKNSKTLIREEQRDEENISKYKELYNEMLRSNDHDYHNHKISEKTHMENEKKIVEDYGKVLEGIEGKQQQMRERDTITTNYKNAIQNSTAKQQQKRKTTHGGIKKTKKRKSKSKKRKTRK